MRPFRWPKRISLLFMVFLAILAAAAALGRYGYLQSMAIEQQSEEAIRQSNKEIADRVVSVIEKEIIASDHTLFDLIDLSNLRRFTDRWTENVRLLPAVEAVVVLDANQHILALASRGRKESQLRSLFERRILPALQLRSLDLDQHAHLHAEFEGEPFLISYTHRRSPVARDREARPSPGDQTPRDFYIALSVDMSNLLGKLLPQELEPLRDTSRFSIVDTSGRVIYGDALDGHSGYLYERTFPSTLWRWRVQMAPQNIWQLSSQTRKRRTADLLLIGLSLSIIVVGMFVLLLAIRKEKRASELKSEFIANVSHELKTPLSLIRMFSELLALGKVKSDGSAREYAEIITRESERLGRLIDNVLDFARIERGKAAYDFQLGDLAEVVERALDVYRYRLDREKVKLELAIAQGLPTVLIDGNAMTLALLNLLENAVKYAGPGEIMVRLRQQDGMVYLSVEDHGPGIPEVEQRLIFNRFYRAKGARGRGVRGSGIGLSLVKHIAEAHGGRVTLQSVAGAGATFTLSVPVARAPEGQGESEGEGKDKHKTQAPAIG